MSTDTTVARLAEQRLTQDATLRTVNSRLSQCCGKDIQGSGPMRYCGECGHSIAAADLSHEVRLGVADTIRTALAALPARHCHISEASAEIVERLTASVEAGDRSWTTANAIVIDAHDEVACSGPRDFSTGLYEAAEITAALDMALRRIGLSLTVTTLEDRVVVADAPRGYKAVTA